MLRNLIAGIAILFILISMVACSNQNTNTPASSNVSEPSYAGDITENILLAMNNGDYAKFSQNFDDTMKKAIPQTVFDQQIIGTVRGKIGDYVANSKKFAQGALVNGDTALAYQTQFSNEPAGVIVTISFKDVNGTPQVDGLFFNSPKLRGS